MNAAPEHDEPAGDEVLENLRRNRQALPDDYRARLLVRTNTRIDDEASMRAISISWVGRVALPGIVAIIAFLVGLEYYVPEVSTPQTTPLPLLLGTLSDDDVDSLYSSLFLNVADDGKVFGDVFVLSQDHVSEYLIDHQATEELLECLGTEQADRLLVSLENKRSSID